MSHRYPLEALVAASGLSEAALGRAVGLSGTTLKKARETGLSWSAADRYATRVGLHPSEVWDGWGDDLMRVCAERSCDELFHPYKSQRFCSQRCARREWVRNRYQSDPEYAARKREWSRRYYADCREYVRARQNTRRRDAA